MLDGGLGNRLRPQLLGLYVGFGHEGLAFGTSRGDGLFGQSSDVRIGFVELLRGVTMTTLGLGGEAIGVAYRGGLGGRCRLLRRGDEGVGLSLGVGDDLRGLRLGLGDRGVGGLLGEDQRTGDLRRVVGDAGRRSSLGSGRRGGDGFGRGDDGCAGLEFLDTCSAGAHTIL